MGDLLFFLAGRGVSVKESVWPRPQSAVLDMDVKLDFNVYMRRAKKLTPEFDKDGLLPPEMVHDSQ